MKRFLRLFVVAAVMALSLVSCTRGRVISRSKMAKIYAEMLVRDQWISTHSYTRGMADTSFVYRDILRRYGCTEADYRASVDYYIKDSERYSRILKKSAEILEKKHKELQELQTQLDSIKRITKVDVNMARDGLHQLSNLKNPGNMKVDSVVIFLDTARSWDWHIDPSKGWDTLWRGPMMDIDTTIVCLDSIK